MVNSQSQDDRQRTAVRRGRMACRQHPERLAVIELADRGGACWECYLGRPKAERHLGCTIEAFYARPANQVRLF